jgi:predicted acyl esterase
VPGAPHRVVTGPRCLAKDVGHEGHDVGTAGRVATANEPLVYRFALPNVHHVFLPGHRIMVQVQSSWFPLYDRNPQTFVPSIFWARPEDFRKATQRIHHAPGRASFVELPLVATTPGTLLRQAT